MCSAHADRLFSTTLLKLTVKWNIIKITMLVCRHLVISVLLFSLHSLMFDSYHLSVPNKLTIEYILTLYNKPQQTVLFITVSLADTPPAPQIMNYVPAVCCVKLCRKR